MQPASPFATPRATDDGIRPRDNELDLFGLTHPGLVRDENEDQFLLCTVHPQVEVHGTSIGHTEELTHAGQRLATILLVADGVGGSAAGSRASRVATEAVTRYVATSLRCYQTGTVNTGEFEATLRAAALDAHETVRSQAAETPEAHGMATTLSLAIVVWPWMYVVQVGDSRCYLMRDGMLTQITRDQTFAEEMVQRGVLTREDARNSPLAHVLSSAIGASEALPEITRVDVGKRGSVILVCTDGLTKHVSDEEISDLLARMTSAEQVCGELLSLALERGGTDNITVVIGRALEAGTA